MSSWAERPFVAEPPGAPELVAGAARRAAAHWGLPGPEPLRTGQTAIFTCGDEVVVRVCRTTAPPEQAIWLAAVLRTAGVRVPRFARAEPWSEGPLVAFAIERLHATGDADWTEIGAMVARVHALPLGDITGRYPLPWCASFPWWDFAGLLDDAGGAIDDDALAALRRSVDRHLPLVRASRGRTDGVCHGDVHPGNVMQTAEGAVLLDWDLLCTGPGAWDHAPLMTWTQRWGGAPGIYEAFAAGYGQSLRDVPLAEAIAELRLVAATLMRVRAEAATPAGLTEAAQRLRWWRNDPDAPMWRAQ